MRLYLCFAALLLAFLVLNDQFQTSTALRKRKIFKKLRDLLPLLLALKGKKKLLVLPIPIPIKVHKEAKPSWPSMPSSAWPAPPSNQISWSSAPISWQSAPDSYLQEAISSWPSMPSSASQSPQSSPPTKITHTYLPPEYLNDNSALKKSVEQYLTSYVVKDAPSYSQSISGYNSAAVSSAYNAGQNNYISNGYLTNPPSYGRNRDLDARRPLPNKPTVKRPFGQPLDDYENGKGLAAVYNENGKTLTYNENSGKGLAYNENSGKGSAYDENSVSRPKENRVQFQNSVSGDYSAGGGGQSYTDNTSNEYKSPNEINYEDNRVKSVSADYAGSSVVDNEANNEGNNYDENNELNNENKDADQTYVSNRVPAVRIPLPGYKKKAKV